MAATNVAHEPDSRTPEPRKAVEFLQRHRPEGPHVLGAIPQEGGAPVVCTFPTARDAADWIGDFNSAVKRHNVYFTVNPTLGPVAKKPERVDLAAMTWLHIDIDPRVGDDLEEERARILRRLTSELPPGVPAPTAIVFSGGGYQAFWRLAKPFEINGDLNLAVEAGLWNKRLAANHPRDAVQQLCLENSYDPICDYLAGLEWDGVERLDNWMTIYLGAEDNQYTRAVGRLTLIAAVRRARQPGTKFDTIAVWEGAQGVGKSRAVAALAGGPEFFSDEPILGSQSREVAEAVEGVWFYELGELENISKADVNRIKAFASRTHDRARKAYAHFKDNQPRRCIFIATTNEDAYLRDTTGNRRFLPVRTPRIDMDALERDRDQLLAEAAACEAQGESIVLPSALWATAAQEQRERETPDPWEDILGEIAGVPDAAGYEAVFSQTLLREKLGIPMDRQNSGLGKRVAAIMGRLGWEGPDNLTIEGRRGKGYRRPPTPIEAQPELPLAEDPF